MKVVIVDGRMGEDEQRKLMLLGFHPLSLPKSSKLPVAISSHPDTLLFRIGDRIVSSADYCDEASYFFGDLRELCPHITLTLTGDSFTDKFPGDCLYNALTVGRFIFCREDSISRKIPELAEAFGFEIVSVKQGYPACSALALGDKAIITSDKGLLRAAEAVGIPGYWIEPGHISLPPYEYGFIGGASGVVGDNVYFIGDYKRHPSADIIDRAMEDFGYRAIALSDKPLSDLGGMLFI